MEGVEGLVEATVAFLLKIHRQVAACHTLVIETFAMMSLTDSTYLWMSSILSIFVHTSGILTRKGARGPNSLASSITCRS